MDGTGLLAGGAADTRTLLAVERLGYRIGSQWLLRDVGFTLQPGEILGVIGASGAGKSTLLRTLNGLVRPSEGTVRLDGRDVGTAPERDLTALRRRVGMVFQQFHLLSSARVLDNVALPLRVAGVGRAARTAKARDLLALVGLADHATKYPAQLSGGQKQRVGIARALALDPVLLLCDEATSALDTDTTTSILSLLRDINRRLGLAIVAVTHDLAVVRAIADRVLVLEGGRVVEQGRTARVVADPAAAATLRIVGAGRLGLPPALAARLHTDRGRTALLRLDPRGPDLQRPLLDELARALGRAPVLVAGGIDHVADDAFGTLFVTVPDLDQAAAEGLRRLGVRGEVLGWLDDAA